MGRHRSDSFNFRVYCQCDFSRIRFSRLPIYQFFCKYHPSQMKGTVTVT